MAQKFIEILRALAHISGQMKSLSEKLDEMYDILSDKSVLELFEE